jgi:hypothetical protein
MRTCRALLAAGSLVTLLVLLTLVNAGSRPASANPIGGLTAISAGEGATCAVTTQVGVKCWGDIGMGGPPSSVAVDVLGLSSGVVAVSEGSFFACALTDVGGVECWGNNYYGQLGNGMTQSGNTPARVTGLDSGVAQISAGFQHTCAVMTAGGVKCWGANDYGQLGDGTAGYSATPVDVVGLSSSVTQVSAAFQHTCAVMATGGVECWGRNDYGQLGDGSATSRLTPVSVSGLNNGVAAVAGATNYTCAVISSGGVKCWGLGYGRALVDVPGLSDVIAIDSGYGQTCVLTQDGGAECWGSNGTGELGDGRNCGASTCLTPVQVTGLSSGVAAISAGSFYTCAVLTSGGAKCWGGNGWGELGNGSAGGQFSAVPVDVVMQDAKPTPTRTPCPPAGCPTPTPRPIPPMTGLDFSIAIDANGDGMPDCGTGADQPRECRVAPGSAFQVVVSLNALPPNVPGYDGFDATLNFAGVQSDGTWTPLWPDCAFPAQSSDTPKYFIFGCTVGIKAAPSTYAGPIGSASFTCDGNGSVTLVHGPDITDILDQFNSLAEAQTGGETLAVTCGPLQRGDDNCNRTVNTVDATLTLQLDAKLLGWLGCPQQSDVNLDSVTNAVDALLTKQYDAELVPFLPPQQQRP